MDIYSTNDDFQKKTKQGWIGWSCTCRNCCPLLSKWMDWCRPVPGLPEAFCNLYKVFQRFTSFIDPTVDGHITHTKILSTIEYARDNGVVMLSLPPHTSHKLQPLDRSVFKPLKSAFNAACSTWLRNHPGRRISVDKLGELFNAAYLKAATIENAVSGFRCTGIVPFNEEI